MSEHKHTKGPWRVGKPFFQSTSKQYVTPILWDTPSCEKCGKSNGEYLVAWTFPNALPKPQYKFNARLIAEAPEMLEALKDIRLNNEGSAERKRGRDNAYKILERLGETE
jgi:hypothetical protein